VAALLATVISAGPIFVLAAGLKQTPGSKIAVSKCLPHRHTATDFPCTEGFLAITYVNEAKKPAKEIDFQPVSRGTRWRNPNPLEE